MTSYAACSYGYDPLGLGQDPAQVEKYRANELIHARWAMLAAAGIIIPEGLQVRLLLQAVLPVFHRATVVQGLDHKQTKRRLLGRLVPAAHERGPILRAMHPSPTISPLCHPLLLLSPMASTPVWAGVCMSNLTCHLSCCSRIRSMAHQ